MAGLVAVAACGSEVDSSPSSSGSGGSGGSTNGGGSGGAEIGCPHEGPCVTHLCGEEPCDWDCELAPLCAQVTFTQDGVDDVDAARCVVEALRDGTEGSVSWQSSSTSSGMTSSSDRSLRILPTRRGLGRSVYANYGGAPVNIFDYSLAGPLDLEPASYFDTCLSVGTPLALRDCISTATEVCEAP